MDLFTQPKTSHVLIGFVVWLAGMLLLTLAITDLFSRPFFENAGIPVLFLMLGATAAIARVLYKRLISG
jgi:formate-dependent nitrite reductase membrane component NrfD